MSDSEIDVDLVQHFRNEYGPFSPRPVNNRNKQKCDFCGEQKPAVIVEAYSTKAHKYLFVCLGCDALELLVGTGKTNELKYQLWANPEEGLPEYASDQFVDSTKEAEKVLATIVDTSLVSKRLFVLAQNNWVAGKEHWWKIIPDLLKQYAGRGTLSPKQWAVLKKYNNACKHEKGKKK